MIRELLVRYKWYWIAGAAVCAVILVLVFKGKPVEEVEGPPTSFFQCARIHEVKEGFPRRCRANSGEVFVEYVGNHPMLFSEQIHTQVYTGAVVHESPFRVVGEATAEWFGQSGFKAELHANGRVIDSATVRPDTTEGIPVTAGYQPFTIEFTFTKPKEFAQGAIVLKKSGKETASSTLIIPVVF